MRRLKHKDVAAARDLIKKKQGNVCPLCKAKFTPRGKKPALDHCHTTGYLRGVLCLNCNGVEGKVFSRATRAKGTLSARDWLANLVAYYDEHATPQHGGVFHPTHKTEDEKRLARNAKARARRAALKKVK